MPTLLAQVGKPVSTPAPTGVKVRKNIESLTPEELQALRTVFSKMYDISKTSRWGIFDNEGYQYWAGLHGYPPPVRCQHGTPLFVIWHRAYLYFLELEMQKYVPGVALPYWDWTSVQSQNQGMPKAYTDEKLTNDSPNPLYKATIEFTGSDYPETFRNPGSPTDLKRLADLVSIAQTQNDYQSYSPALENPHNGLHGWVGGTMGIIPYAGYDPIFWGHHSNIERFFVEWQASVKLGPPTFIYEDRLGKSSPLKDVVLTPFPVTVGDIWDVSQLGYVYEPSVPDPSKALPMNGSKFNAPLIGLSLTNLEPDPEIISLRLHNVTHPKQSFEVRVFLNQPDANADTPMENNPHYAGSLYFFGHGECRGSAGHCDPEANGRGPFDLRPPHHLTPMPTRNLDVTKTIKRLATSATDATVTLVAVDNQGNPIPKPDIDFDGISLVKESRNQNSDLEMRMSW